MPNKKQEYFKTLLKENGLKVTNQRIAILEVLEDRPGEHLTAEEIYGFVKEKYPDIGLATVYRTIQMLSELEVIDKLNLDDGFVRYEIGRQADEGRHHHHHLVCLGCHSVFTFEDDLLEVLEERIQDSVGFKVVDHEVKLYGYCKQCLNKGCDKEPNLSGKNK